MDTRKTGRFISELRRQKGYTQKELAEKLAVTDKAVSRWETGKGLPDPSLLQALSETLGVTVSEILVGEKIPKETKDETTDKVIIEAMNYSKRVLASIVNGVLLTTGILLFISPLFMARRPFFSLLGIISLAIAFLRIHLQKRNIVVAAERRIAYAGALSSLVAALVLEILPYGAVLIFAPSPEERAIETFSYFSMVPFGYANFFPLPTGLLTIAVIVLLVVIPLAKPKAEKLQNIAFVCTIAAFVLSFMPGIIFNSSYMTAVSIVVSSLLLLALVLQAVVNRKNTV